MIIALRPQAKCAAKTAAISTSANERFPALKRCANKVGKAIGSSWKY